MKQDNGYYKAEDFYEESIQMRTGGIDEGKRLELGNLDQIYRIKEGCTTYITGIPGHGKTEFHLEILVRLTKLHGWKHYLWSPETGKNARLIYELQRKFLNKPEQEATQGDWEMAFQLVNTHFFLLKVHRTDLETVYEALENTVNEQNIQTFSIDPFNELMHDFTAYGGREDKYLSYHLGNIRQKSEQYNLHTFITIHPHQQRKNAKGIYEPPTIYDLSGGAMWANKGQMIMCCYRENIVNHKGEINNELKIIIQKNKPKECGRRGEESVYFDEILQRFYWQDSLECKHYPH